MTDKVRIVTLVVRDTTENGLHCEVSGNSLKFWVPKSHVKVRGKLELDVLLEVEVPEWLALRHRQICGDAAFEAAKARRSASGQGLSYL